MERLNPQAPKGAQRVSTFEDPNWHVRQLEPPQCKWAGTIKPLEPWQYNK